MTILLSLSCFVLHVFADFWFQISCGLHNFKQRKWWEDKCREVANDYTHGKSFYHLYWKFGDDWIAGMFVHALSWSIITFAPLLLVGVSANAYGVLVLVNAAIHAGIDHLKANCLGISLNTDQALHIIQLVLTIEFARLFLT